MVRNKNQTENERQPHHVGENFSVVPSVIKRNRNIHTAAEGVLLSAGSTIRMEGKKMKFNDGGLFCFDRDESCFIKYLVTQIQTAQLHLRNDQLDVNADFEECIAAIRKFEEPLCVAAWAEDAMATRKPVAWTTSTIGLIDVHRDCADCPFCKDTSWRNDPEILDGIKLVRDAIGKNDSQISDFIEYNICPLFSASSANPSGIIVRNIVLFCANIMQPRSSFARTSKRKPARILYFTSSKEFATTR